MSEHEVLINFHSGDVENVTAMCSRDENLDWMEHGSKMQLLSRDETIDRRVGVPLCPTPLTPFLSRNTRADFRIANRRGIAFNAGETTRPCQETILDRGCKNSPNRSHSPFVMKLLMSPPDSSCSCRSNC